MTREEAEAMAADYSDRWAGHGVYYEACETEESQLALGEEQRSPSATGGWYVRRVVDSSRRG